VTPRLTIDALRALAIGGLVGRGPDVRAVAEQILRFIESDEGRSLDDALGLTPARGEPHWKTTRDRILRNAFLRLAADQYCSGLSPREAATTIHAALNRYVDHEWHRDRDAIECPPHLRGTIREHLWSALRAWPNVLSRRQIEEIVSENSVRVSSPNELPPHAA